MKLNKMTKEQLESYSYTDLAKMIIEQSKKKLNTAEIFKKICKLLDTPEEYESKIGDFYTDMTTDKTFILLEDGTWDLSSHHTSLVDLEEESEEDEELTETEDSLDEQLDEMAPKEYHEMDDDAEVDDTDLDDVDELDDELTIVDEDEME